ncbi:glycine betaine ABC transporter substrate-binding protein [Bacillus sp. B1-b2]|uniref:glycine betaine ABC transporter substrate-binding protein n=1 Tax=Bacillus sp. B1-b2 TaxID=2653201 RepID=UPI0012627D0A|nr:glycine betaine ABC transporter substrate-binding protein [Bacillus sp. B1-b2]KAB7667107.1 glycine/betaine ABC transporter [Bacillus sp. B1-b2]
MLKKLIGLTTGLALTLGLAACGSEETGASESVGDSVDYEIIGIDPGSGLMNATLNKVLPGYGLDDKWDVIEGSDTAMTAELSKAIKDEEPIIVTGWVPHWMWNEFDLKMLKDPKKLYGGEEQIHTLVRKDFEEEMPEAYKFFDQFEWSPDDMQDVMVRIQGGTSEEKAAEEWVSENTELVDTWLEGVSPGNGEEIKIPYVAWSDATASSNVVKYVLENELNYKVNLMLVEPGVMWAAIAEGSGDAMVTAALPTTHEAYYKQFEGDFVDLGPNFTGLQNGLVVPAYMDIDSIEDLMEE